MIKILTLVPLTLLTLRYNTITYPTYDKNTYTTYNIIRLLMLVTDNYKCSFTFRTWQRKLLTDIFVISQQFQGNYDRYSVRTHAFRPALYARYVRIQPRSWRLHISMRMELYGCAWSKWMSQQFLRNQSKLTEGMKSLTNLSIFSKCPLQMELFGIISKQIGSQENIQIVQGISEFYCRWGNWITWTLFST